MKNRTGLNSNMPLPAVYEVISPAVLSMANVKLIEGPTFTFECTVCADVRQVHVTPAEPSPSYAARFAVSFTAWLDEHECWLTMTPADTETWARMVAWRPEMRPLPVAMNLSTDYDGPDLDGTER